jgi:signal transduction histidine kinase
MSYRPRRPRFSIRARFALAHAVGLFSMGWVIIGFSYWLVDRSLSPQGTGSALIVSATHGAGPSRLPAPSGGVERLSYGGVLITTPPRSATTVKAVEGFAKALRAQTMRSLVTTWAEMVGAMAVASGLLGWLLATYILRPLRSITGAARRLSASNLHERISLAGPRDELRELADTFDDMLGRLDTTFASQRRFVADASHELRTPLAIMRAQIDLATSDPSVTRADLLATSGVVRDAVDRSERLLDGLLMLARGDRGLEGTKPVDLAALTARAVEQLLSGGTSGRLAVRSTLRLAAVRGDRALLDRMVSNLLENAVTYNRPRGWVEVTTEERRGRSVLRVENSGCVVPPERVDELFEPFRRLSQDRTTSGRGAGLGLSIVRSVVRAHGGEVRAQALRGGGLLVVVELPACGAPSDPTTALAQPA